MVTVLYFASLREKLGCSREQVALSASTATVSTLVDVLRDHGLLESRKEANKVFYRIGDPRVLKMISLTREIFCSF